MASSASDASLPSFAACVVYSMLSRMDESDTAMVRKKGFNVQGPGFRVQGSGFRVQGSRFKLRGSGFKVQGSGFRVQG